MKATFRSASGTFELDGDPHELAEFARALGLAPEGGATSGQSGKKRVRYDHDRNRARKYSDTDRHERLRAFIATVNSHKMTNRLTGPVIAEKAGLGSAMALGQVKKDLVALAERMQCPVWEIVDISETNPKFYRAGPRITEALSLLESSNPDQLAVAL